jgi:UDP-3-O-[3-hydroxymyristoyl] N-acetylglucosamine deacetylase
LSVRFRIARPEEFRDAGCGSEALPEDGDVVAVLGGRVVGWVGLRGTFVVGPRVVADHREAGLGAALLQLCLQNAAGEGADAVFSSCDADHVAGRRLLVRFGFERWGPGNASSTAPSVFRRVLKAVWTRRRTLQAEVRWVGVGVHSGAPAAVRLAPTGWGRGLRIFGDGRLLPWRFEAPGGCTVLGVPHQHVATPEHMLAAIGGLGLTDLDIYVDGPELPILDGSARPWCQGLQRAGFVEGPPMTALQLWGPIRVSCADGEAEATPAASLKLSTTLDYGPGFRACANTTTDSFVREAAGARTFVLRSQIDALLAAGRGLGACEENTIVWPARQAWRWDNEPARHKLIDLMGDLTLLQRPLIARVHTHKPSHALHHALVRRIALPMPRMEPAAPP